MSALPYMRMVYPGWYRVVYTPRVYQGGILGYTRVYTSLPGYNPGIYLLPGYNPGIHHPSYHAGYTPPSLPCWICYTLPCRVCYTLPCWVCYTLPWWVGNTLRRGLSSLGDWAITRRVLSPLFGRLDHNEARSIPVLWERMFITRRVLSPFFGRFRP